MVEKKLTKESEGYKGLMESYRNGYLMSKLVERMLADMKKQMWITFGLWALGYIGGIFLGIALERSLG